MTMVVFMSHLLFTTVCNVSFHSGDLLLEFQNNLAYVLLVIPNNLSRSLSRSGSIAQQMMLFACLLNYKVLREQLTLD